MLNQLPSPNDQFQEVMPGDVDVSVNWTNRGARPDTGEPVNAGIGREGSVEMYPDRLVVLTPVVLVTVRFTVKVPVDEYVWDAFRTVMSVVLNQILSPNDQFHIEMPGDAEVSLNCTARGGFPWVGDPVKSGMGRGGPTTMYPVCDVVFDPDELVTERFTVYDPCTEY